MKPTESRLSEKAEAWLTANQPAKFSVEYCEQCDGLMVICPRCGNNSCNGGYGEDGKCPVCPSAHALMYSLWMAKSMNKFAQDEIRKQRTTVSGAKP